MADNSETTNKKEKDWIDTLSTFFHPRVLTMLFLGFSAGLPLLLIFGTLSLWLGEAGVERKAITYFAWAGLGYSFKFLWAPLVDKVPIPFLTAFFGRRRAWMLLSQVLIMIAIAGMAITDPALGTSSLTVIAYLAVLLGFSSATQDIVVDAYRVESGTLELQAMMSSSYVAGYRIAMLVSGAVALFMASLLGSEKEHYVYGAWKTTYFAMAATMLIGIATTLIMKEPVRKTIDKYNFSAISYLRLVLMFILSVGAFIYTFKTISLPLTNLQTSLGGGALVGFLVEAVVLFSSLAAAAVVGFLLVTFGLINKEMAHTTWVEPVADFFKRYGMKISILLLALIGLYRISDIVLGVIANVFYQEKGYTKIEIASAVKTVGVFATIFGGYFGGFVSNRLGIMKTLMWGAIAASVTNLFFLAMASMDHNTLLLYIVSSADNFAGGFATTAFVALLSGLTNVSFTAVQYAIFSSIMTLIPKVIGGYSGTIATSIGYPGFFIFTTIIGIPVLWLIYLANKHLKLKDQ